MFVDYLTIFMGDIVAGFALLLYFVWSGMELQKSKAFAPAFGAVGLIGVITGLHMTLTWPLPGTYNIVFGEAFTLYGFVFLAAAFALAKEWDLTPVTIFGLVAGVYALILSAAVLKYGLTKHPTETFLAYLGAGLTGVLSPVVWKLRNNKVIRVLAIILLVLTLIAWFTTMYGSLIGHTDPQGGFGKWVPLPMRK